MQPMNTNIGWVCTICDSYFITTGLVRWVVFYIREYRNLDNIQDRLATQHDFWFPSSSIQKLYWLFQFRLNISAYFNFEDIGLRNRVIMKTGIAKSIITREHIMAWLATLYNLYLYTFINGKTCVVHYICFPMISLSLSTVLTPIWSHEE